MLAAGSAIAAVPAVEGPSSAEVVRDDWYLRESLRAIADWETILARWEQEEPTADRTPVFPVPESGQAVAWPIPFPNRLMPPKDRGLAIRVRFGGGRVTIEQLRLAAGLAPRESALNSTAAPGSDILGYKHFGGGGKDQWYHHYERRFDQLGTFRPQPAPFAVELDTPADFGRGPNEVGLRLTNVAGRPLDLSVSLVLRLPNGTQPAVERKLRIEAGKSEPVVLPLELASPGGALAVISIRESDKSYWFPLLTHVEDVDALLETIGQILHDAPDPAGSECLAALWRGLSDWSADKTANPGLRWRALFEEASRLRDELLLSRLRFDTLLFVKRKPYFSEQPFMDAHHLFNRPGGESSPITRSSSAAVPAFTTRCEMFAWLTTFTSVSPRKPVLTAKRTELLSPAPRTAYRYSGVFSM